MISGITGKLRDYLIIGLILTTAFTATYLIRSPKANAQSMAWRPVVMATNGMVASGHPLASMAGQKILHQGGNAIDAAIATWAAQGVVEPAMTGLGGDMFILIYLAKTGEVKFINGTGPAPQRATLEFYKNRGGIPYDGPLASDVPGAVDAAGLALEKYGTQSYTQVLQPAIDLAVSGFPVSHALAYWLKRNKEKLSKYPSTTAVWFKNGHLMRPGEIVVQKAYAETLKKIAAQGRRVFYEGEVGSITAQFMRDHGGLLSEEDLADYHAEEAEPIHINYRGFEVYECPPNSQGHVLLQALNILEGFNLKYMGHNSAPYIHLITEALKLCFADRNKYVGDPRYVPPIPMKDLLSKDYAASRRALIDPNRAIAREAPPGSPLGVINYKVASLLSYEPARSKVVNMALSAETPASDEDTQGLTTYLCVIDKDHNMVSITSSLCSGFGSGMIMGEAGYLMNNRMVYYFLEPDNVNVLVPGKRTRHTINPALVLKDGKPFMAFGTPGGDTQPQTELQFFLNLIEFGMNVQEALEVPAVITSSFRSSFLPHEAANKLRVPTSLPLHVREELAAKGHDLVVRNYRGVGSVKAILIDLQSGTLMGGVSPTMDSYVIGW